MNRLFRALAVLAIPAVFWSAVGAPPSPTPPPLVFAPGDLVRVVRGEMLQFNGKNLARAYKHGEFTVIKQERDIVSVSFLKDDGTVIAATMPAEAVEPTPPDPAVDLRRALEALRAQRPDEVRQRLARPLADPATKALAAALAPRLTGTLSALQLAETARTPAALQGFANTLATLRDTAAQLAQTGQLSLAIQLDEAVDRLHTRVFAQTRPLPPSKIDRKDVARRAALAERAVLETRQAFALRRLFAASKSLEAGLQAEPERPELKAFQTRLKRDLDDADYNYTTADKMRTRGEKGVVHALSALDDGLRLCADHPKLLALRKEMQTAYDQRTAPLVSTLAASKTPAAALEQGRLLYTARCTECHDLEMLETRGISAWQKTVGSMSRRANLTRDEQSRILDYLAAAVAAGEREQ